MSVFVPHRENITHANTTSSVNGGESTGPSKIIFPEEKAARPVVYYVFLDRTTWLPFVQPNAEGL